MVGSLASDPSTGANCRHLLTHRGCINGGVPRGFLDLEGDLKTPKSNAKGIFESMQAIAKYDLQYNAKPHDEIAPDRRRNRPSGKAEAKFFLVFAKCRQRGSEPRRAGRRM